jgi:hypothetical protein
MTLFSTYICVIKHCFMPIFEPFDIISQSLFYVENINPGCKTAFAFVRHML